MEIPCHHLARDVMSLFDMSDPKKPQEKQEKTPPPSPNPNNDPDLEEKPVIGDEPLDPRERIKT
jgi:hypothetical protein